jgi:DNA repair photolyase
MNLAQAAWEPGTATPHQRLFVLQRLLTAKVPAELSVEPLIPYVNDAVDQLRRLFSAAESLSVRHAVISFLQLRPGVAELIAREAPAEQRRLVLSSFPSQRDPSARGRPFDHVAHEQALSILRRTQRIAREHGIRATACRCQNPGLPADECSLRPPTASVSEQHELFEPEVP